MGYTKSRTGPDGSRATEIKRVLWIILGLNLLVACAKLAYGLISRSVGMTADGFHSMFDGTSNVIGLLGMGIAARPADDDHPYGHSKYETFASVVIGAMLLLAAWRVGTSAFDRLMNPGVPADVNWISFAVMLGTLCINIFVTRYERRVGERLGSEILVADASHTGSDVLVSIGVIIGLIAVKLGFPIADPIVGLVVAGFILVAAVRVFRSANETLSDRARIAPEEIRGVALSVPGVLGCHEVRTRGPLAEVYVDLHIQVDASVSVAEGHAIAERVEKTICESLGQVTDVIAHLEPLDEYQKSKTAMQDAEGAV
ncbi:MAG: cation transporter [Actinobacteria bacterium HGW-Actinobacteria-1]|jgi:cation diffusion facilitator family transporter|nr:MAG: cation transporter [Actinobacteria bacterium HGW-Actinobacteria-1]